MASSRTPGVSKYTHYTNIFMTLNTNFRPTDTAEAMQIGAELQAIGRRFFTLDEIEKVLRFRYGDPERLIRYIDKIEIPRWSIELGTTAKGQRVHLHALIKIVHHTYVQLDSRATQEFFNEGFAAIPDARIKNCYAHFRWLPATEEMALAYIGKQQVRYGTGGAPGVLSEDPNYSAAAEEARRDPNYK